MKRIVRSSVLVLATAALLSACGGGGGGGGGMASYTVGGTISGVAGAVVLQNNTADDLSRSSNGIFTFATSVADGAGYSVTIKTQPAGPAQVCIVGNGTGTISGANVTNVTISCSATALPKTGQTTCYDAAGALISCATTTGQGQDGALQKGVSWPSTRFTVASSGTGTVVTDNLTGLMLVSDPTLTTLCSSATTTTWQGALDYVACLNANSYLGYTDWRLPNVNELESLVDSSKSNPALPASNPFTSVQNYYWSSTTFAYLTSRAGFVNMSDGVVDFHNKTTAHYVWPVRDAGITPAILLPKTGQTTCYDTIGNSITCTGTGQDGDLQIGASWPSPRFTVASGGTGTIVTDDLTGLMWTSDAGAPAYSICTGGTTTWQGALDYVACLNVNSYLGYADWRLPNRKELRSLGNYGQSLSSTWLNSQGFTNVQANYYWSSTTDASLTSHAWYVHMGAPYVEAYFDKTGSYYVWPVRGGR